MEVSMKDTRIQRRAVCPACFAVQAIRGTSLVDHGYKRPQDWHQNVGTCSGAGHAHFGTPEGRDYTAQLAQRLRDSAAKFDARVVAVLAGTEQVLVNKRVARGVVMEVVKENPSQYDRENYARSLEARAKGMRMSAVEFEKAVAQWMPAEPVEVEVEEKKTLVHWRGGYWGKYGKACAGSAMGAMKGHATRELEHVTCDKCKAIAARQAAKEVK
jgi:hypothetical protein